MSKIKQFRVYQLKRELLRAISGGQHDCQYYENKCMQTAFKEGNTFLLKECDKLCP